MSVTDRPIAVLQPLKMLAKKQAFAARGKLTPLCLTNQAVTKGVHERLESLALFGVSAGQGATAAFCVGARPNNWFERIAYAWFRKAALRHRWLGVTKRQLAVDR